MLPNLVDQLNMEWSRICEIPDSHCAAWSKRFPPLAGCYSAGRVLAAIPHEPDATLGFLLLRHRQGETVAGRIVLQTMLGKLVRMSYTGIAANVPHALDDLVTQMWCHIASYPLERRPRHIAANLALDSFKMARREWAATSEVPVTPSALHNALENQASPDHRDITWTAEQLIDAAYALSLITETTRDILVAVYGPEGLSGASAGARWACSPAAIRTRCRAALKEQLTPLAQQLLLAA